MNLKRTLGKTGYEVFPVAYGGIVSMKDGQGPSDGYVSWAVDHGVNYFDVAPSYQDAEEKLGNSLIGRRDGAEQLPDGVLHTTLPHRYAQPSRRAPVYFSR